MSDRKIVHCATTEEFLDTYYKPDRFRGRGEEYAQALIDSHEKDFQRYGHDLISNHDSVMGISVWRFPEEDLSPSDIVIVIEDGILADVLALIEHKRLNWEVIYLDPKGDDPDREKEEQATYKSRELSGNYLSIF